MIACCILTIILAATELTWPAPVLSHVPVKYHRQRFNGSLLKENVFRREAGPEVDAAWEALGLNCALIIFSYTQLAFSKTTSLLT
jgi:hypothetical protein